MANDKGLNCCENMLDEKGIREKYEIFVSCLMHTTNVPSTETVVIPFRTNETRQVSNRHEMKGNNRKSKLFYVSCDYLNVDTAFGEQVRKNKLIHYYMRRILEFP